VLENYTEAELEAALTSNGWTIREKKGSLTFYQTNFYPGGDLIIDWSQGSYAWESLEEQLVDQNITPQPIYDHLSQSKE